MSTGLILLVLLAVETLTTLALRSYLPVHIFLGLLLLPPVGLKLASTGWRFMRYYTRNKPYRLEGPPRLLLRVLAPLLVASTLTLFGSGVALLIVGHGGGLLLGLHAVSFGVWGVVMIVHVLAIYPVQQSWLSHRREHRHTDGSSAQLFTAHAHSTAAVPQ
jgi:membrane protein implicated in regulation of membrane protease activity